jgi:hypothetical protein
MGIFQDSTLYPRLILPRRVQGRLVTQELVNLRHHLGRQLGQQLQTLHVVHDLLRSRSARDHRRNILVLQTPRQSQLG